MRTLKEKIQYTILEEIDVYINLVNENVFEESPAKGELEEFILKTVVPRFNKLRGIINSYEENTIEDANISEKQE